MNLDGYTESQLLTFKHLLDEKNKLSWGAWWKIHSESFRESLSRPEYVCLKHGKVQYVFKILAENQIEFSWTAYNEWQNFVANYSEEYLDEHGELDPEKLRKIYNGSFGYYLDGQSQKFENELSIYFDSLVPDSFIETGDIMASACLTARSALKVNYETEFFITLLQSLYSIKNKSGFDDYFDQYFEDAKVLLDTYEAQKSG